MIWLKSSWRWAAFNLFAVCVSVYVLSQGSTGWENLDTFDSGLESGKWAIRFLLTSLSMTPLNTYFGWKAGIKLRKSAGLWVFGFASLHVLFYLREAKLQWLNMFMPLYLFLGLAGMTILTVLACTSNRWSMKSLGKNWKRLHRLVYICGGAVITHSILATMMSKKLFVRDPESIHELKIYLGILSVLLIVRIPIIRTLLQPIPVLLKRVHKASTQISPVNLPQYGPDLPNVHGHESSTLVKPTFVISIPPSMNEPLGENPWSTLPPEGEMEVQSILRNDE